MCADNPLLVCTKVDRGPSEQVGIVLRQACTYTPSRNPSPPHPKGWPLSWVPQVVNFPEDKFYELRGPDATLYVRFLRGSGTFSA